MKKLIGILLAALGGTAGCANYEALEGAEIKNAFILNSSPTFKGYHYQGSDDEYHFFTSRWDFRQDERFKIPASLLSVGSSHRFKLNDGELRVDLLETGHGLFAENEFYRLYIQETTRQPAAVPRR